MDVKVNWECLSNVENDPLVGCFHVLKSIGVCLLYQNIQHVGAA